jgi:hypothetical protein
MLSELIKVIIDQHNKAKAEEEQSAADEQFAASQELTNKLSQFEVTLDLASFAKLLHNIEDGVIEVEEVIAAIEGCDAVEELDLDKFVEVEDDIEDVEDDIEQTGVDPAADDDSFEFSAPARSENAESGFPSNRPF